MDHHLIECIPTNYHIIGIALKVKPLGDFMFIVDIHSCVFVSRPCIDINPQ